MKILHVLLGCLLFLLTSGVECFSNLEKEYLVKNIDEIVIELIQHGYDEQQILSLFDQQFIETVDTGTGGVFAIVGCIVGAGTIFCIAGCIAGGMWWYHEVQKNKEQAVEMEDSV